MLVYHNVESILLKRRIRSEKYHYKIIFFYEWLKLRQYERKALKNVNQIVAVSENDKMELRKLSKLDNISVVENGVDTEYFRNDEAKEDEHTLVYVGGINWFPNYDAVKFFSSDILPKIKKVIPDVKFRVVGTLTKEPLQIRDNIIDFLGFVDDTRPIINKSAVFVVPLRVGGGTRLKILNALSMEKAIVSTSIGCEGLDITNNKNIIIADDPGEFAKNVIYLLKNPEIRRCLGKQGRLLVMNQYDWKKISEKMNNVYLKLLSVNK